MAKPKQARRRKAVGEKESRRESGLPGGGQGRIDEVGRSGVYPASGPFPRGPAELRTPAEFVAGQTDAEGRPVEGGSELIYFEGKTLLGGATPPPSGTRSAAPQPVTGSAIRSGTRATKPRERRNQPEVRRPGKRPVTKSAHKRAGRTNKGKP
jgi:hypothetical protein